MAPVRELIGGLPADAVLAAEVLRGVGHAQAVVRIDERDPEVVLELLLAEREAPARAADHVRGHRHVLGAAGEDEVRLAELDLLRAKQDRLQARAAEPVDREGGGLLRHAGREADVPREVHGVAARLEDVAEDDLVDLVGRDLRALERALRGDDAEVGGGGVAQRAAVGAEGGARAAQDDDVFHAFIVPPASRTARTMAFSTAAAAAACISTVLASLSP